MDWIRQAPEHVTCRPETKRMNSNPCLLLNPGRVHAGAGSLSALTELARYFRAQRVLIITTKSVARLVDAPRQSLEAAGLAVTVIASTPPEPDVADVQARGERVRHRRHGRRGRDEAGAGPAGAGR